ncbi:MAG: cytochrome c biogenesis protein CcsA [Coriobacteriia bacterium]|nr:cytochrome c biogenesis protein CcsA [Coriobacteriia bacterium]
MPAALPQIADLAALTSTLAAVGRPIAWLLLLGSAALFVACVVPPLERWRYPLLAGVVGLLALGEVLLCWFHLRLWQLAVVVDPGTGAVAGNVAVPPWVESEKLWVWGLMTGVMLLLARTHRREMLPLGGALVAALVASAIVFGKPFTEPLPDFVAQYSQYLEAMGSGIPQAASGAFQGMYGSMTYYYNSWYMWVHPPLLFISYGAFVLSFAGSAIAWVKRRASYEATAYWWARLGYLPLTAGMLLGFPWALLAWTGESWWWSGKVNMSIMMWLLYTAYLHLRLYLRKRGLWRWVLVLAFVSFAALVLTYLTTYVVPGAHSVA